MNDFEQHLSLQAADTTIDQLRHRIANLPERAALADVQRALADLERQAREVQLGRDEIARTEKRLEDEIAMVRAKAAEEDRRLYSGATNSPKELQALQDEIAALGRRQRELEDQELEAMVAAEPFDAELAQLDTRRAELDATAVELSASLAEAEVEIESQLAVAVAERDALAAPVAPERIATYERLRKAHGGIGVARLNGNRCEGCHLVLSAVELDQIRHALPDEEVSCSECGRLLVR